MLKEFAQTVRNKIINHDDVQDVVQGRVFYKHIPVEKEDGNPYIMFEITDREKNDVRDIFHVEFICYHQNQSSLLDLVDDLTDLFFDNFRSESYIPRFIANKAGSTKLNKGYYWMVSQFAFHKTN